MTINVKYLTEAAIEKEAEFLLSEYEDTIGGPIKLPVPVDDITTSHLALELRFADLHQILDIPMLRAQPDILGAIFVEKRLVVIGQHLCPKDSLYTGRYRFSVAHEIGHWQLHRLYVAKDPHQLDAPSEPTVIRRSSEKSERIERQANYFASCLLMPRRRVLEEWDDFLNDRIRTPSLLLAALSNGAIVRHAQAMVYAQRAEFGSGAGHDQLCREVARPIAERFGVSVKTMRIRLEELGLLPRQNQARPLSG
jgi:Zn-dependent peptidase ImmA (M78 family)